MFNPSNLVIILYCLIVPYGYSQSGILDSAFGSQGIIISDIDEGDVMSAMVIQPDQKILVAGNVGEVQGIGALNDIVVVRYLADGTYDQYFGIGGIMHVNPGYEFHFFSCEAMVIQPDGKIVIVGNVSYINEITFEYIEDIFLARLDTKGFVDSTFGSGGIVITDFGGDSENACCVLLQEDDKIVIGGTSQESPIGSGFVISRFESDGEVDVNFGTEGLVKTFIQTNSIPYYGAIQPDGKIIFAGITSNSYLSGDFAIVRYLENGTLDNLFGSGGIVQTDLLGKNLNNIPLGMVLEPDGKITLGGYADFRPAKSHIGIARYNPDGNLDESFGSNGVLEFSLGTKSHVGAIARQPDGKYLFVGSSNVIDSTETWLLARLNHQGDLDSTFGNQGFILTNLEGEVEYATEMLIQNDTRIVVGGFNNGGPDGVRDFVIARYIADFIVNSYTEGEVICPGDSNGIAGVEVSGGLAPYLFSIDGQNYQSESFFEGLPSGEYFITISDSQNPPAVATIGPLIIPQAPIPTGTVEVIDDMIIVSSDNYDFSLYSLNGIDFQTDSIFMDVPVGIYIVFIITNSGCTIQLDTVTITQTSIEKINALIVSVFPNPCTDYISLDVLKSGEPLTFIISNYSGQVLRNEIIFPGNDGTYLIRTNQLTNGLYQLKMVNHDQSRVVSFIVQH